MPSEDADHASAVRRRGSDLGHRGRPRRPGRAVLLGRPASMGRAEVSDGAGVEPATARRFWHAMGFQIVEDDEAMFTEADLDALKRVARLIGEDQVSEELALGMTRAFARTADRLAVWQTQLVAESLTVPLLRGARGTRQSLGARAADRRGRRASSSRRWRTTSSRCSSTSGAAT